MKKAYSKGLALLDEFRKIDSEMPIQMAAVFLAVANEEGMTMKRLGEVVGLSQSSCSRNVAALSKYHRLNKPGHDLLYAMEDPAERRRKILMLTAKGKRIAQTLLKLLED